jgi:hypothetical protein
MVEFDLQICDLMINHIYCFRRFKTRENPAFSES